MLQNNIVVMSDFKATPLEDQGLTPPLNPIWDAELLLPNDLYADFDDCEILFQALRPYFGNLRCQHKIQMQ